MNDPTLRLDARDRRLLGWLAHGEGRLDPETPPTLRVTCADGLKRARLAPERLAAWIAAGWVRREPAAPPRLVLTPAGRSRLARGDRLGEVGDHRLRHGDVAVETLGDGERVVVERAESPLAWLARRRDRTGRVYLSAPRLAAGERLRADFTLARMMPTVTSNWSTGRIRGSGDRAGAGALTDRAIAARDRVEAALAAVGSDLGGVLIDVCCFLKGLETVESERRWPARSAKVVLLIALGRLCDHYGFAEEARGPDRPGRLRAWGSPDHRPTARRAPP